MCVCVCVCVCCVCVDIKTLGMWCSSDSHKAFNLVMFGVVLVNGIFH